MTEPTLALVRELFAGLRAADLDVFLMGGWAEELRWLIAPRAHRDIDLLLRAKSFTILDAFLQASPAFVEIPAKHFNHKRAALYKEVMIEFILVRERQSIFFDGLHSFDWPANTFDEPLPGWPDLSAASPDALATYRANHAQVQSAYEAYIHQEARR